MRALFVVSDTEWSARARAFVLAAQGLAARGHEVQIACTVECPVQVRVAEAAVPVLSMPRDASTAGAAWNLRAALKEHAVDAVFVHTESEHLAAGSALRFGGGTGRVVRRIPPFSLADHGAGGRLATRIAPSGLLFTTDADRAAAGEAAQRIPSVVAPMGVDVQHYDTVAPASRMSLGVPDDARLIVCLQDASDKRRVLAPLRTIALLAPRHPELRLVVLGSARHDELRMHAAALGITSLVTFLGAREDELSVLKAADVGWIAAEGDAAAFAALDFMACGKAVIAERSPLTQHFIVDAVAGVLLAPADPPTTAAAVSAFVSSESQRAAMGNAGRGRVQREFSWEAMVSGFEQAASLAADRQPAPV